MTEMTLSDSERQPCEIWTRCMGYFRPVTDWNIGKKGEHATRRWFTEARAMAGRPANGVTVPLVAAE